MKLPLAARQQRRQLERERRELAAADRVDATEDHVEASASGVDTPRRRLLKPHAQQLLRGHERLLTRGDPRRRPDRRRARIPVNGSLTCSCRDSVRRCPHESRVNPAFTAAGGASEELAGVGSGGTTSRVHPPRASRPRKDAHLLQSRRLYDAPRMRVALFSHLPRRRPVPRRRQGDRDAARATRPAARVPARADLLRPDAREQRLLRDRSWSADTWTCSSEYDAVVVPSGSCAGAIRHQHAMVARGGGDEALATRAEAVGAQDLRALRVPDRRPEAPTTSAPTFPTASPITRPATRSGCSASATARSDS